jgi:hypothetical protein
MLLMVVHGLLCGHFRICLGKRRSPLEASLREAARHLG